MSPRLAGGVAALMATTTWTAAAYLVEIEGNRLLGRSKRHLAGRVGNFDDESALLAHPFPGHDRHAMRNPVFSEVSRESAVVPSILAWATAGRDAIGQSVGSTRSGTPAGVASLIGLGALHLQIASLRQIIWTFALVLGATAAAWLAIYRYCTLEKYYSVLLPPTLCALILCVDLVNQSLSALMRSPMSITFVQALSLTLLTGSWTLVQEGLRPSRITLRPLARWTIAATAFAVYQLMNHQVFYACSLSERVIFQNLVPPLTLVLEAVAMPPALQQKVTWPALLSLAAMVLGAGIFSLEYTDFTSRGLLAAGSMVVMAVPYRLLQRWLLAECREVQLPLLACMDGLFLIGPSSALMAINHEHSWNRWLSSDGIALMLCLSTLAWTCQHLCVLMILRVGSATSYQVYYNMSNFAVILFAVAFFGEDLLSRPLVLVGIVISLAGGMAYSVSKTSEPPSQAALAANAPEAVAAAGKDKTAVVVEEDPS